MKDIYEQKKSNNKIKITDTVFERQNTELRNIKNKAEKDFKPNSKLIRKEIMQLFNYKENKLQNKLSYLSKSIAQTKIYDIMYQDKLEDDESQPFKENESKSDESLNENEEDNIENIVKEFECYGCKCLRIYVLGLFFFIFYLNGFFQLLDLFDVCKKELGIIFKSFFNNKKRENDETFFELYINSCFKSIPEFDFAFFTSFLGIFPLKGCGFFISSIIFTILNSVLIIGFTKFDFEKEKHDIIDFIYILLYFIVFFITFGSISLFAHQKYSEGIISFIRLREKYEKKQAEKQQKEEKITSVNNINNDDINNDNNINNFEDITNNIDKVNRGEDKGCWKEGGLFICHCIGIILAYILNRGINIGIYKTSKNFYEDHFIIIFIYIYVGSNIISLFLYLFFFIETTLIKNRIKTKKERNQKFFTILGFLIYYEKVPSKNKDREKENDKINITQENISKDNNIKVVTYPEKRNRNINQKIIKNSTENRINDDEKQSKITINCNENKNKNINYKDILFKIICPCYNRCKRENINNKYCCASYKLGFRKCFLNSKDTEFEPICCDCCQCQECCSCFKCCQCCICCEKLELDEKYEEEEIFCYVYQVQRKCSWFCDLFFKNNILSLIVHNIVVEIGIIGFETKFNENLENKSLYDDFISIVIYLVFCAIMTLIFTGCCVCTTKEKNLSGFSILSIAFHSINIVFSGLSYFTRNTSKAIINNWLILFPIAYTKFLNFVVLATLVEILDKNNRDILSNSFVMTSIFFIYDIIVFIITGFLGLSSDTLILFQFIFGLFAIVVFSWLKSKVN